MEPRKTEGPIEKGEREEFVAFGLVTICCLPLMLFRSFLLLLLLHIFLHVVVVVSSGFYSLVPFVSSLYTHTHTHTPTRLLATPFVLLTNISSFVWLAFI